MPSSPTRLTRAASNYRRATSLRMDAPQTSEDNRETTPPPYQRRMVARRQQGDLVQPCRGRHPTLLIPGDKPTSGNTGRALRVDLTVRPSGLHPSPAERRHPPARSRDQPAATAAATLQQREIRLADAGQSGRRSQAHPAPTQDQAQPLSIDRTSSVSTRPSSHRCTGLPWIRLSLVGLVAILDLAHEPFRSFSAGSVVGVKSV
jgi:hypothetical protein